MFILFSFVGCFGGGGGDDSASNDADQNNVIPSDDFDNDLAQCEDSLYLGTKYITSVVGEEGEDVSLSGFCPEGSSPSIDSVTCGGDGYFNEYLECVYLIT